MNKNRYRIVFNAARGQRMVVAETAIACGKSAQGDTAAPSSPGSGQASLRALTFSLYVALGMVLVHNLVLPNSAHAQMVADPSAPANQRPTVLTTPNDAPLVNIQTPSAAGVSRNTYQQFDVNAQGAVLNNSRSNVQTQLGGWVQGNPWLARGEARIILNEVNSSNPSQLRGFIEVAGRRAEVIIANPAGIDVDGAGFINASRATLTTGTPIVNAGSLEGYRVQRGTITINGAGLDATLTDYTGILARAVQSNAGLWANNLRIATGTNDISADQSEVRATGSTDAAPTFALDVAQLGGMYAGKIHLIGTEAGVGVRVDGSLGATAGDLVLQSNGWLTSSGIMQATGNAAIELRGEMVNRGVLHAVGSQQITTAQGLVNAGQMTAVGQASITAAQLDNTGHIASAQNLAVQVAGAVRNRGEIQAGDELLLDSAAIDNHRGRLQGRRLDVQSQSLDNRDGQIWQTGDQRLDVRLGTLDNTGAGRVGLLTPSASPGSGTGTGAGSSTPVVALPSGVVAIAGATHNDNGTLAGQGIMDLQVDQALRNSGVVSVAHLQARGAVLDNSGGDIRAARADVQTRQVLNTAGQIVASQTLSMAADALTNQRGLLSAQNILSLDVQGRMDNTGGMIQSTASDVQIRAGDFINPGRVDAARDLAAQVHGLANDGGMHAGGNLLVVAATGVSNAGALSAQGDTTIQAGSLHSSGASLLGAGIRAGGTLSGTGDLQVLTTGALVAQGQNLAAGRAAFTGASIDLGQSQTAARDIGLAATQGDIRTTGATVAAEERLWVQAAVGAAQTLDNTLGHLSAAQLDIRVANITNAGGRIVQTGLGDTAIALTSQTGTLDNTGGLLASNGAQIRLQAQTLLNTDGRIQHAGTGALEASAQAFDNQRGQIVGNARVQLMATQLHNQDGAISGDSVAVNTQVLGNTRGQIGATQALAITASEQLDNAAGSIHSVHASVGMAAGAFLNAAGSVHARTDLSIHADSLDNTGSLYATGNQTIAARGAVTNSGLIAAQGHTRITSASLDSAQGSVLGAGILGQGGLAASGDLTLATRAQLNAHGSNLAAGDLSATGASIDLTGSQTRARDITLVAHGGDINTRGIIQGATPSAPPMAATALLSDEMPYSGMSVSGGIDEAPPGSDCGDGGDCGPYSPVEPPGAPQVQGQTTIVATGRFSATANHNAQQQWSNQHGSVSAGLLEARVANLDNSGGSIHASQGIGLLTGRFDNTAGLVQAGTSLVVNTQGQALVNAGASQHASGLGGLAAGGAASIHSGNLDNTGGYIGAVAALHIQATQVGNLQSGAQHGQIRSGDRLHLQATDIDNQGGDIQAAADLALDAGTGSIGNQRGLIRAGGHATLTAARIGNQNTLGDSEQGIEGANVSIDTAVFDNTAGAARADGNLTLTSAGSVNNTRGLISAADQLRIQDPAASAAAKTLAISNTGGNLIANQRLDIQANTLGLDGQVLSRNDLSLALLGDHTIAAGGQLMANRDLTIELSGDLANSGLLRAGRSLHASAHNISNTATGEISATTTRLDAAQTLTNRGLIDGASTQINAQTLSNTGSGRIYGGNLGIAAQTLVNDTETVRGVRSDAVLAARGQLDIGAQTLTNREGALIFSAGNLAIGGALDADRRATGLAQTLNNNSATIESLGDMALGAALLRNTNEHFSTAAAPWGSPEGRFLIQPQGSPTRYGASNFVWVGWSRAGLYRYVGVPAGSSGILGQTVIARVDEQHNCTGDEDNEVCSPVPGAEYPRSDPAWRFFNLTPPAAPPAAPVLAAPTAPNPAGASACEAGANHNASACTAYRAALAQYTTEQTAFAAAWSSYQAGHAAWQTETQARRDALDSHIEAYNARFANPGDVRNWTQYVTTVSQSRSVITASAPGHILAGAAMHLSGGDLVNDKSRIVAGTTLSGDLHTLRNIEAEGVHITHETGTAQSTRSRWRGGLKRYHQRDWDAAMGYTPPDIVNTITLPVSEVRQNTALAPYASGAIIAALGTASVGASAAGTGAVGGVAALRTLNPSAPGHTPPQAPPGGGASQIGGAAPVQGAHGPTQAGRAPVTQEGANGSLIRSTAPNTRLPTSALFRTTPASTSGYLVETDPRFANHRQWLSSDYMLQALAIDPATTQKRLGDGFYEQKLIIELLEIHDITKAWLASSKRR